jgi:hypothetical protein
MTDLDPIRVYPDEYDAEQVDTPNQIVHDLRGTFGYRAVALHDADDTILEWYAYADEFADDVVEWWPDYYDEPVWSGHSIYAFTHPIVDDGDGYFALYRWPDSLDTDAEVVR